MNIIDIIHVASDKTNAKILRGLPTNTNTLMKELNLTKMPINVRLNTLEQHGLIKRHRGTGNITTTDLLKNYFDFVYKLQVKKAWIEAEE